MKNYLDTLWPLSVALHFLIRAPRQYYNKSKEIFSFQLSKFIQLKLILSRFSFREARNSSHTFRPKFLPHWNFYISRANERRTTLHNLTPHRLTQEWNVRTCFYLFCRFSFLRAFLSVGKKLFYGEKKNVAKRVSKHSVLFKRFFVCRFRAMCMCSVDVLFFSRRSLIWACDGKLHNDTWEAGKSNRYQLTLRCGREHLIRTFQRFFSLRVSWDLNYLH